MVEPCLARRFGSLVPDVDLRASLRTLGWTVVWGHVCVVLLCLDIYVVVVWAYGIILSAQDFHSYLKNLLGELVEQKGKEQVQVGAKSPASQL